MRVCVVGENHARVLMAGAEYQTELLADELASRAGVDLHYLARRVPTGSRAQGLGYSVRKIGDDRGIRRRAVIFDAPELNRALVELKPDVIYQQCRQSYTAVCARYARKAGIPFFFHVASDSDLNWRWVTLHLSPNTPFDVAECMSGMWGIRKASHVIAQTERQRAMLREHLGRSTDILIRNFQPFPENLPGKPEGPAKILFVANFKDVKRPWLFMDLAESFADRSDLQFIMIGRPTMEPRLAGMMERATRIRNLQYLGELPIDQVNAHMCDATVHVNTSSFEGFPNTFLQAWGRGALVATLDVDPDGCLSRGGLGFCAQGSMQRLRAFIHAQTRSAAPRREMQQKAFDHAHKHHGMAEGRRLADMMLRAAGSQ